MWFKFENIEEKHDLVGQSGKKYSGFVVTGMKKGFQGEPDTPYQKTLFSNQAITVIERGITRPGQSVVQFFQKAAQPGDMFDIKSEREGKFWRWISIAKLEDNNPTYEPLTDEQVKAYEMVQAASRPQYAQPTGVSGMDAKLPAFLQPQTEAQRAPF